MRRCPHFTHSLLHPAAAAAVWLTSCPVGAIVFYDTADGTHNNSAPTGAYENSGWQYQGYYGGYLGTMISPTHFITAQHFGTQSGGFVHDSVFSGTTTQTYTVDTSANGGVGYYDIAGTDLRVYQITGGTFSSYAPIYTGSLEAGSQFVVFGRGGPRGAAVNLAPEGLKGWLTGGTDGVARWGVNTFEGSMMVNGYEMLMADFDAVSGVDEAHLSVGDSGGAAFINDGGVWKLVGLNYAVQGFFDEDANHGAGVFSAALFDTGGYYIGSGSNWTYQPDALFDTPSELYLSRISSSAAQIQTITASAVPEPAGVCLLGGAGVVILLRRRRTGR